MSSQSETYELKVRARTKTETEEGIVYRVNFKSTEGKSQQKASFSLVSDKAELFEEYPPATIIIVDVKKHATL